jgi:hypothetical protein
LQQVDPRRWSAEPHPGAGERRKQFDQV